MKSIGTVRVRVRRSQGLLAASVTSAVATALFLLIFGDPLSGTWFDIRGRVVDQFGAPVPGAAVNGYVAKLPWAGWLLNVNVARGSKIGALTARDGSFRVWGFGTSLRIGIKATGYVSIINASYSLSGASSALYPPPDPLVYRVWKLAGPQPLVDTAFQFRDGNPHWLDVVHGRCRPSAAEADVCIQMTSHLLQEGAQYVWSYALTAVNGGLAKTTEIYPFLAPSGGYQPRAEYQSGAVRTMGGPIYQRFFLQSRSGNVYALLDLEFRPEGAQVDVRCLANPAASRILEPGRERRP